MIWIDKNINAMPITYVGNKAITTGGPEAFNVTEDQLVVDSANQVSPGLPVFEATTMG